MAFDEVKAGWPRWRRRTPVVADARVVRGSGGGPDKTILNSPRFLTQAGYHNLCVYLHPPGDAGFEQLRRKAQLAQAPLLEVLDRGPWDGTVILDLLRLCRREQVAIWHGHDYKTNLLGLLLNRFWPMRLVTTVHGWVHQTRRTPLYYAVDRWCLPKYERVICVSADLHESALASGVPADRCVLIENGIDTSEFRRTADVADAKCRLGLPKKRLLIGAMGRLSEEKGFDLLIRAVDRIIKQGIDASLLIVGEGDARGSLQSLIAELRQEDRIRLHGFCANPMELYEAMDVFALSSLREGLPNVVLEAMAMERPVVATRVGGVPKLVQDNENGLLIEPGNTDDLAQALGRLLSNPDERRRIGRAGRETVESRYSFAVRMEKVRAIYDQLLFGRSCDTGMCESNGRLRSGLSR